MMLLKTNYSRHFCALLKLQTPSNCLKNPYLTSFIPSNCSDFLFLSSVSWRSFWLSALFEKQSEEKSQNRGKSLTVFFREAIGVSEKIESGAFEGEENSENAELKEKLRNLEGAVREVNKKKCGNEKIMELQNEKPGVKGANVKLSELFAYEEVKCLQPTDFGKEDSMVHKADFGKVDSMVHKELSSDMQTFTHQLYMKGYLEKANFFPKHKFDLSCFSTGYARDFLKFAAVNFGRDHQEIAKWLSASDLKKVALFGCPSRGESAVYAAKHMRRFFKINEQKACQKCVLRESCKYANKESRKDSTKLDLARVMRVLIMYALELVPQQLVVPEDINNSVSQLLKEIIKLSETVQ